MNEDKLKIVKLEENVYKLNLRIDEYMKINNIEY